MRAAIYTRGELLALAHGYRAEADRQRQLAAALARRPGLNRDYPYLAQSPKDAMADARRWESFAAACEARAAAA